MGEINEDSFLKWKGNANKKIDEKSEALKNERQYNAISGTTTKSYDKEFHKIALEDYGELGFIEHSIKEGTEDEQKEALKMIDTLYKDRADLKAQIYINKNNFEDAEGAIINALGYKDNIMNLGKTTVLLEKANPGSIDRILDLLNLSNPKYAEKLKDAIDDVIKYKL